MATKSIIGLIALGKVESAYGQGATVTGSTDAIQTIGDASVWDIKYTYTGERAGASYTAGNYRRAPTKGRNTDGVIKVEGKGAAATYTLSVTPPNLHALLLGCGLSGSMEAASWKYKPVPLGTTPSSVAFAVYTREEVTPISGAVGTFTVAGADAGPAVFEFSYQGLAGIPTQVSSPPARVWIGSGTMPPNNSDINMTIGSFRPVVKSWSYDHGLAISDKMDLNAQDSHGGKAIGLRKPTLKVTIEQPDLSSYDAYSAQASGTVAVVSLGVGSVANNRFSVSMSYAQISELTKTAEDTVATLDLTFVGSVLDASSNDDVVWTWF